MFGTIRLLACALMGYASMAMAFAQDAARESTAEIAKKTLGKYCFDCHSGDKPEGGIRVDFLAGDSELGADRRVATLKALAAQVHRSG